jgi:AraC-like DNA-binding protein
MVQLQRNYTSDFPVEGQLEHKSFTYDEYVDFAAIPYFEGVSGRVIAALCERMGQTNLSIELIASDMRLTKRTLQRRLQNQNTSFAILRDDVRFHYAVKFLVDKNMRVDQVSVALDFSDRTSFTNAFKRWTGLSPSAFKKRFIV